MKPFFRFLVLGLLIPIAAASEQATKVPKGTRVSGIEDESKANRRNRIKAIRVASVPFSRKSPDFSHLDQRFAKAKVIGLGQTSHGSAEVFQAQADLFRYLVQCHGVRTLMFEDCYAAISLVDEFVQGKTVDAKTVAQALLRPWRVKEVRDLFNWMRDWNALHPDDRVRVLGIDGGADSEIQARSVEQIRRSLPVKDSIIWEPLERLQAGLTKPRNPTATIDEALSLKTDAELVQQRVEVFLAKEKPSLWLQPLLAAGSLVLQADLRYRLLRTNTAQIGKAYPYLGWSGALVSRDLLVAKNAALVIEAEGPKKVAFWAHSAHVAKVATDRMFCPAGRHLTQHLGNDAYCAVFIGTRTGEVMAGASLVTEAQVYAGTLPSQPRMVRPLPNALPNSFEALLGEAGQGKDLVLDMGRTHGWLNVSLPTYYIGGSIYLNHPNENYAIYPLAQTFDAYVFLDRTTATIQIDSF